MNFYFLLTSLLCLNVDLVFAKVRNDCACGESNSKGTGRIVNGKITTPHKYPWMAGMFTPNAFMCGGAVISDRNILTAGHCIFYVQNPYNTHWVLGMHDQDLKDGDAYKVAHVELHPKFRNLTVYDDYDMALVTVQGKIRFGDNVRPICLPSPNDDFTGRSGIVAGWGRLNEAKDADMSKLLQEAKIRVRRNDECKRQTARLVTFNSASMLCGYEFSKDACQGDSGGPYFIETDLNRYVVFGVVSFGDGCGRSFPGIYGRLSEPGTLTWIKSYIFRSKGDTCRDPSLKSHSNAFLGMFKP